LPFANEHAARLRAPGGFVRIRQLWARKGIRALGGPLKSDPSGPSKVQTLRFNRHKFTVKQAKAWLREHGYKPILFEPATGTGKSKEGGKAMAFRHGSTVADDEPKWGDLDKAKLPFRAFVWQAPETDEEKASTWRYPHHWVKGGGNPDDDGRFTTGTMYLHEQGLNVAWAAAQGARTGKKAPQAVITHLSKHRKALGLDKKDFCPECGTEAEAKETLCAECGAEVWRDTTMTEHVEQQHAHDAPIIDRAARRVISLADGQLAAKASRGRAGDPGWIEGYGAVWNNVDAHGEIMRKGAFSKSIEERVTAGKVKLMATHYLYGGGAVEVIGTITEAKEDDYGLWFRAKLSSVQLAQDVRTKVVEGHLNACSVGFGPLNWGFVKMDERDVIEHKECKLYEITVTPKPANEMAILTGAKDLTDSINGLLKYAEAIGEKLDEDAPSEERGRIIQEMIGGPDQIAVLSKSLQELGGKLGDLQSAGAPHEPIRVDVHAISAKLDRMKLTLMKRKAN